jgi:hypothetical protein
LDIMSRRRPGFGNLTEDSARQVLGHLGRKNRAALRMASKATRDAGRAEGSCQSQSHLSAHAGYVTVTGVAIGSRGAQYPWRVSIRPDVNAPFRRLGGANSRIEIVLKASISADPMGGGGLWGLLEVHTDRVVWDWWVNVNAPPRTIKDQIMGCVARELGRHAASLAQMYTHAVDAMVVQSGPTTAAQVLAAIRNMTEAPLAPLM